jgi:hypothetical protein
LGATLSAGEAVGETAKRFSDPAPNSERLREQATLEARKAERRGAQVRRRAQRELKQRRDRAFRRASERVRSRSLA